MDSPSSRIRSTVSSTSRSSASSVRSDARPPRASSMTDVEAARPWSDLIASDEIEVYRRAGYQRAYGLGSRPALLIVDVEYNFTGLSGQEHLASIAMYRNSCGPMAWESIPYIARLLELVRSLGLPVAYSHGFERPDMI